MRQLKGIKVGHFVKYNGIVCQVNCFYTNFWGKHCTLIEVGPKEKSKRMFTPAATEKVEYLGKVARTSEGIWVQSKPINPFLYE